MSESFEYARPEAVQARLFSLLNALQKYTGQDLAGVEQMINRVMDMIIASKSDQEFTEKEIALIEDRTQKALRVQ